MTYKAFFWAYILMYRYSYNDLKFSGVVFGILNNIPDSGFKIIHIIDK